MCEKVYSSKHYLKRHKCRPINLKTFPCLKCPQKFTRKSKLKRHALTHSGEKPYQCDTCDKAFLEIDNLYEHKCRPIGTFPCLECPQKFPRNDALKRHALTHSGEKPYQCETCDKAFSRKDKLDRHKMSHQLYESRDTSISIRRDLFGANLNEGDKENNYVAPGTNASFQESEYYVDNYDSTGSEFLFVDPQIFLSDESKYENELGDDSIALVESIREKYAFCVDPLNESETEKSTGSYTLNGHVWSLVFK